ncbi:MAG: glycosyltransferase [Parachlamydiaceae bacterium]
MIKVLFVFSGRGCVCVEKRSIEVLHALFRYQHKYITANGIFYDRLDDEDFEQHDIILFQRLGGGELIPQNNQERLFRLMERHRQNKIYVYDIDDYIFELQNELPIKMMRRCHWATATTRFLADKMALYQPQCHVIPTQIDLEACEKAPQATGFDPDLTHIGWFSLDGQGMHIINQLYPWLLEKYANKIAIHFFCDTPFQLLSKKYYQDKLVLTKTPVPITEMYSVVKAMDFLINPLDHHPILKQNKKRNSVETLDFLHAKSEIKYLHAGAAGKPLISTDTPSYSAAIQHNETGFLAKNENEWMSQLSILIDDNSKRLEMGRKAKEHIYATYSYEKSAANYAAFFLGLRTVEKHDY